MSKNNRSAREMLEKIYGKHCFIHQGIRKLKPPTPKKGTYKGKSIAYQLTYHHLKAKRDGGKATVENGACVCRSCHDWLEQLSEQEREKVNDELRAYKKRLDDIEIATVEIQNGKVVQAELLIPEEREEPVYILAYDISEEEWQKFKAERNKRVLESQRWERGVEKFYEERN